MSTINLFELPVSPLPDEVTIILLQEKNVRIERIVSEGHCSDWYDQDENEFVALLQGSAVLAYEDGTTLTLVAGDTVFIPAHQKHRVCHTSSEPPCVWLCVFWRSCTPIR